MRELSEIAREVGRQTARLQERWLVRELARLGMDSVAAASTLTLVTDMHPPCYGTGIAVHFGNVIRLSVCPCMHLAPKGSIS